MLSLFLKSCPCSGFMTWTRVHCDASLAWRDWQINGWRLFARNCVLLRSTGACELLTAVLPAYGNRQFRLWFWCEKPALVVLEQACCQQICRMILTPGIIVVVLTMTIHPFSRWISVFCSLDNFRFKWQAAHSSRLPACDWYALKDSSLAVDKMFQLRLKAWKLKNFRCGKIFLNAWSSAFYCTGLQKVHTLAFQNKSLTPRPKWVW